MKEQPTMNIITVDFETYYDSAYSLSKMTTEEYIRDELFEVVGVSVKVNSGIPLWFSGPMNAIKQFLGQFPWEDAAAVAHNAPFDMAILNWHFGIRPKRIACTLAMSRALHGTEVGASLAAMSEYYGVGEKGTEVLNALGKGRLDFSPEELERYGSYCSNDVELTYKLFDAMAGKMPVTELRLIDLTTRMFTEPVLTLDDSVLSKHLTNVQAKKALLMSAVTTDKSDLMSNPKLAELLIGLGVNPPTKISLRTNKETWAFGKTDEGFKALLEHSDPRVQAIVAARLGVKSTLEETRTERFLEISTRGTLPVPLRYYAAHCLTGDAEVLTPTGWQTLAEWRGGDIAQWSPKGALRFAPATANCFEVDEELVVSNARYHKAVYTKGHTIPGFSGRGVFKTLKAGDLLTKRLAIPLGGSLDGDNGLTELDARLAAMVQADGSIRDNDKDRSVRFGFKKPRKIARCKALLEQAGVIYTTNVESDGATRIRVAYRHWRPLVKLLSSRTKNFSPELLMAPLTTKIAFMEEIAFWDGDVEPHGKGYTYNTTSEHNARFVQTMAHVTGVSAFISEREREGWSKAYRVYVRRDDETRSEPKHYTTRHHVGAVYCPTTETGYFLVRQNGCITVTGNTGRWGGDDKINLQNLPRKSPLKKAMLAPEGYTFIDCDSSQIEARTLAWLAGQKDLVEFFEKNNAEIAQGIPKEKMKFDPYKIMASGIYAVPVDDVVDDQRFVGKTTILGCLAKGTLVATNRGWVPIEEVSISDRLWDGEEWVCHQGLVEKGTKETLSLCGLWLTPDHKVLCGTQWLEAQSVVRDAHILSQALGTGAASWSSLGMSVAREVVSPLSSYNVVADAPNTQSIEVTSNILGALGAPNVANEKGTGNATGSTSLCCQTPRTGSDCSTVSAQQSHDVTVFTTKLTPTMGGGGSLYVSSGEATALSFYATCKHCPDGTTPHTTWTELTTAEGTSRETFNLCPELKTTPTEEKSASSRRNLMTYDIAYAGPRNRYTVATDRGPLIVHNCGYGMGAAKFQAQLLAFGVSLPIEECQRIIEVYRTTYTAIPKLWREAQDAVIAMSKGYGAEIGRDGLLKVVEGGVLLPNGMMLRYPNLREVVDPETGKREFVYDQKKGRAVLPTRIYGGKLVENICQALARIIIGEQMLMIARRLRVVMTVHDAVGALAPTDQADEARAYVEACMRIQPKWAVGLPLNCESKMGASYGG